LRHARTDLNSTASRLSSTTRKDHSAASLARATFKTGAAAGTIDRHTTNKRNIAALPSATAATRHRDGAGAASGRCTRANSDRTSVAIRRTGGELNRTTAASSSIRRRNRHSPTGRTTTAQDLHLATGSSLTDTTSKLQGAASAALRVAAGDLRVARNALLTSGTATRDANCATGARATASAQFDAAASRASAAR
jgi:hypothetical protein